MFNDRRSTNPATPSNGATPPSASNGSITPAVSRPTSRGELGEVVPIIRLVIAQVRARWLYGLLAAVMVASGLVWALFRGPPTYTAEATLVAESPVEDALDPGAHATFSQQRRENAMRNHQSLMQSRSFRLRLADSLGAEEAAAVQQPYLTDGESASPLRLEQILHGAVEVERERGREYFTVQVQHRNPDLALLLADRFTSEYLALMLEENAATQATARGILQAQTEELGRAIELLQEQRRDYRREHNLISVEENAGILAERLRRINQATSDLKVSRSGMFAQLEQARASLERSPRPFNDPTLASFGAIPELRTQEETLQTERDLLARQFGPSHPRMLDVTQQLAALDALIAKNFQLALADLQGQLDLATASETRLNEEMAAAFDQSLQLEMLAAQFNRLGTELEAKGRTRQQMLARLADMNGMAGQVGESMRVVDPAFIQPVGIQQHLVLFGVIGVASLLAFIGVPLLLFLCNERVTGSSDLESALGKELLGAIPRLKRVRAADRPHVVRDNARPQFVEPFLSVIGQLELISRVRPPKSILVTSTLPGEGKSMFASNLAASFTRLGRHTVLVDFDLRRPAQHEVHGTTGDRGLLTWAADGCRLAPDLVDEGGPLGLSVLPDGTRFIAAGGVESQPTRLLIAPALTALFARLQHEFEIVIVDTPPAGVFQDALILASHCQETVLIAREGRARVAQVRRVVRELESTGAPAAGVVLNAFTPGSTHPHFAYRHLADQYGYKYSQMLPPTGVPGAVRRSKSTATITGRTSG